MARPNISEKHLEEFACMVKVKEGMLLTKGEYADGTFEEEWGEVINPEPAETFLPAVNKALGTSFRIEDFTDIDLNKRLTNPTSM